MPFTIDEDKMQTDPRKWDEIRQRRNDPRFQPLQQLDPMNPPTKQIPHMEFPMVVYLHPTKPYLKKEHRNTLHEVVHVEMIPAEHQSKLVQNEAELKTALEAGWVKKPYIPKPAFDPNADLYKAKA